MREGSPLAHVFLGRVQLFMKIQPIQDLIGLDGLGEILDQLVKLLLIDSHRLSIIVQTAPRTYRRTSPSSPGEGGWEGMGEEGRGDEGPTPPQSTTARSPHDTAPRPPPARPAPGRSWSGCTSRNRRADWAPRGRARRPRTSPSSAGARSRRGVRYGLRSWRGSWRHPSSSRMPAAAISARFTATLASWIL